MTDLDPAIRRLAKLVTTLLVRWLELPRERKLQGGAGVNDPRVALTGFGQAVELGRPRVDRLEEGVTALLAEVARLGRSAAQLETTFGPERPLARLGDSIAVDGRAWPWQSTLEVDLRAQRVWVRTGYAGRVEVFLLDGAG